MEQIIACTTDQCVRGKCGKETSVIGYESSEQLDVEPAKYFVRVKAREPSQVRDLALRQNHQGGAIVE